MDTPEPLFHEGEKVLCFHGPLMYEAKCRKVELRDGKRWEFLIHFIGWKRKWDEWVTEERILKFNDDNLERQRRLTEHHRVHSRSGRKTLAKAIASPRMSPPLGSPSPGSTASGASSAGPSKRGPPTIGSPEAESPGVKRKKARTDPSIETEEEYLSKLEVKIRLPDELKRILVDDWAAIQQQGKLLSLPTKFTVETIFQEFLDAKAKMISGAKFETLKKTTAGIREYFNVMLASQLLYKPERDQYDKLTQGQDKPKLASEVYGAVHLVRLFTKLGHCLVYTSLDESQVAARQAEFADVLKFISKKAAHYFRTEDYVAASKDDKALVTV